MMGERPRDHGIAGTTKLYDRRGEFRRDEILPVFGAINRVHVIVVIGMAHVRQALAGRIAGLVPRLQRSDMLGNVVPALPGWADVWQSALRASEQSARQPRRPELSFIGPPSVA